MSPRAAPPEHGFAAIPHYILRDTTLPPGARFLYSIILSYAYVGHPCTASMETLCEEAGISPRTFWRSISLLKERELIRVEGHTDQRGRFNHYTPVTRAVRVPIPSPKHAEEDAAEVPVEGIVPKRHEVDSAILASCQESTDPSCQMRPLPSCNEEEDAEEEHPPYPPQAGGAKAPALGPRRPTTNRGRQQDAYRAELADWAAAHFPGADANAVGAVIGDMPAAIPATPAAVRGHAESRGGAWASMLEPQEPVAQVNALAGATR